MARTEGMRCITRVDFPEGYTHGWNVRVIRRGIRITEFFSDKKYGGRSGALSEAMHFRDRKVRELKPFSKVELARRKTARNRSGIPGVRRGVKKIKRGEKVFTYEVWSATGSPAPGKRKARDFYISKLGEDDAREAAISQRLRWEQQMARNERKARPKSRN